MSANECSHLEASGEAQLDRLNVEPFLVCIRLLHMGRGEGETATDARARARESNGQSSEHASRDGAGSSCQLLQQRVQTPQQRVQTPSSGFRPPSSGFSPQRGYLGLVGDEGESRGGREGEYEPPHRWLLQ